MHICASFRPSETLSIGGECFLCAYFVLTLCFLCAYFVLTLCFLSFYYLPWRLVLAKPTTTTTSQPKRITRAPHVYLFLSFAPRRFRRHSKVALDLLFCFVYTIVSSRCPAIACKKGWKMKGCTKHVANRLSSVSKTWVDRVSFTQFLFCVLQSWTWGPSHPLAPFLVNTRRPLKSWAHQEGWRRRRDGPCPCIRHDEINGRLFEQHASLCRHDG